MRIKKARVEKLIEAITFKEGKLDKSNNWIREIKLIVEDYSKRCELIENKKDSVMP